MSALIIIGFIFICLIIGLLGSLFVMLFVGMKRDVKKDSTIDCLREQIKSDKIRFDMLNEMFNEYKDAFPIKTKYRVNSDVYIVDEKMLYRGVIVEIHQGQAREITYTVQYVERDKTALAKTVICEQNKVYKTLAEAIEAEKLV